MLGSSNFAGRISFVLQRHQIYMLPGNSPRPPKKRGNPGVFRSEFHRGSKKKDIYGEEEMPESYSLSNFRAIAANMRHDYEREDDNDDLLLGNSVAMLVDFFSEYSEFLDVTGPLNEVAEVCRNEQVFETLIGIILNVYTPSVVASALEALLYLLNCLASPDLVAAYFDYPVVLRILSLAENPELSESEEERQKLPELSLFGCLGTNYHIPIDMFNAIRCNSLHIMAHLARHSEPVRETLKDGNLLMKTIEKVRQDGSGDCNTVLAVWDLLEWFLDADSDLLLVAELIPFAEHFSFTLERSPEVDIRVVRGLFDVCDRNIEMCEYVLQRPGISAVFHQLMSSNRELVSKVIEFVGLVMSGGTERARSMVCELVDWQNWGLKLWTEGAVALKATRQIIVNNFDKFVELSLLDILLPTIQRCAVEGNFQVKKLASLLLIEIIHRLPVTTVKEIVQADMIEFLSESLEEIDDDQAIMVLRAIDYLLSPRFEPEFRECVRQKILSSGLKDAFERIMDTDNEVLFDMLNTCLKTYFESEQDGEELAEL